jgi:hypothetical protein
MTICVFGAVETEQNSSAILCYSKKNGYNLLLMQGQENLELNTQDQ